MIDEEWLRGIRFRMLDGTEITELLGTGGTDVVFGATMNDGRRVALRTPRQNLAWHIKEVPAFLSVDSTNNVDRINRKLVALVGDPTFEQMTGVYDRLYGAMVEMLSQHGTAGLLAAAQNTSMAEAIPLFVQAPALRMRLEEIASEADDAYNFDRTIDPSTAARLLDEIERLSPMLAGVPSDSLCTNPLYIWGGAVLDGLFVRDDLPRIADFIQDHFGSLSQGERVAEVVSQAGAVADFATQVLEERNVAEYVSFCAACGVMLVVFDSNGQIVGGL